jgi:hypothetical protein
VSPRAAAPDPTGLTKEDVAKAAQGAVAAALADPASPLGQRLADLAEVKKSLEGIAALGALRAGAGTPRSVPSEGGPPSPARPKPVNWSSDLSAEMKKSKAANPPKA